MSVPTPSTAATPTPTPMKTPGTFLNFSELAGRPMVDAAGVSVGRLADLSIRLGEPYPIVRQLFIRPTGQKEIFLIAAGNQVRDWARTPIELTARLSELRPGRREDETQILVGEALLDKQVLDVSGAKLERVNDLNLLVGREGELILAHIDVGLRGLVRRMGWERGVDGAVRALSPRARYLTSDQFIGWKYVVPTVADPAGLRLALAQKAIKRLHPADLADILEELPSDTRQDLFDALEVDTAARVLSEVEDPRVQEELLTEQIDPEKSADVLETMPPDAAADVLAELPEEDASDLLKRMQPADARAVETLMEHEEDTAGGLMTSEIVTFPGAITVAEAFQRLREAAPQVEFLYQFYVVDEARKLVGLVNVRRLFLGKDTDHVRDVMAPWSISVKPEDSPAEVAEVIEKYNLSAVPVVDESGVLVGEITVDDILSEVLPLAWKKKLQL
jgi:magnesium transporter